MGAPVADGSGEAAVAQPVAVAGLAAAPTRRQAVCRAQALVRAACEQRRASL
jgi:hypothetical protein